MIPERYSSYKDPSAADLILRCMLITDQLINRDLLETLRTYHAHEIERDPQMFLKEFPHLYYVLCEDVEVIAPIKREQLPQQQGSFQVDEKGVLHHNSDSEIHGYTENQFPTFSEILSNTIFTAYKFLFPNSI